MYVTCKNYSHFVLQHCIWRLTHWCSFKILDHFDVCQYLPVLFWIHESFCVFWILLRTCQSTNTIYYGAQGLVTVYTVLSQFNAVPTFTMYSLRSILIFSHLYLSLPGVLVPSGFVTKILYAFLIFRICVLHVPPISSSLIWSLYVSLYNFLHPSFFLPLRCKYSPQHPVPEHTQSLF